MNVRNFIGAKHFLLGELVDLGRRLTNQQLEKMQLLDDVISAEQQYLWRIRSVADISRDFTGDISKAIQRELVIAEKFVANPERKGSCFEGNGPVYDEKRTLPVPGTLIIRRYKYQHPWPERTMPDGTLMKVPSETFRFVVVDTPCQLLRLGDEKNLIYRSVSGAAVAATGSSTDGWRFFDIH